MLSVGSTARSLVQQKKEQWAREREEMTHLYLPWGIGSNRYSDRLKVRNQFSSSLELHKQNSYERQETEQRQRSPSLPPIRNVTEEILSPKEDNRKIKESINRNISSSKRFTFYDEDGEGDTSGYGSETLNVKVRSNGSGTSNDANTNLMVAWQQEEENRNKQLTEELSMNEGMWSARSPRSVSTEEGRPRWGDRGVATGRLWEPTAPTARLPQMQNQKKGTPAWVERGLNMIENTTEVLVIDQGSSTNSGIDCDRSSCNGSEEGRTYLRGQNVPIEPDDKVHRENRRIKALELQSAILSQLEDREKLKREEKEKKLREEKLEELRIQREQEQDRLRFEEERRKTEERQLLEQRKLETLKKALEDAERKARQEKEKRFNRYRQNVNKNYNEVHTSVTTPRCENTLKSYEVNVHKDNISQTPKHTPSEIPVQPSINNNNIEQNQNKKSNTEQTTDLNSPGSNGTGNLNFIFQNVPPISLTENQYSIVPIGINGDMINNQQNSLQLAVLVPQNISHSLYSVSLNSLNTISESVQTCSRVLTPRKFRNTNCKDVYTQTDLNLTRCTVDKANETDNNMNIDKDYHTIDDSTPLGTHNSTYKKDRRFRSEERYKKDLENRPKWGVNRPIAQYKKQSEKDPFYSQKRKIRQKHRPQPRQYLSQSSDDSRSPSPPLRSGKVDAKQRNSLSQSYWKNKRSSHEFIKLNNDLSRDFSLQVEYNQLDQINANDFESIAINNSLLSPSKRVTLSQKFINDKYGNRKLWNDEIEINKSSKSNSLDIENRKKITEQFNIAKRDYVQQYGDKDHVLLKTNL